MIDTRIPALVAGASSLVFGGWAALGDVPELGIAAGMLGMLAGAMALGPRVGSENSSEPIEDPPQPSSRSETTGQDPAGDDPDHEPTPADQHGHRVTDIRTAADQARSTGTAPFPDRTGARRGDTRDAAASTPSPENALTDPVTGLFSEDYLLVALESRLASARRHLRPVAIALVDVTAGLPGENTRPADPKIVAEAMRNTVRDSDIACRLGDGTFGVILEDTPENGAVWTVERVRRNLVSTSGHHTLWAGVACYPAHAFDSEDLMEQVRFALTAAREWNQDRIEVAVAE